MFIDTTELQTITVELLEHVTPCGQCNQRYSKRHHNSVSIAAINILTHFRIQLHTFV